MQNRKAIGGLRPAAQQRADLCLALQHHGEHQRVLRGKHQVAPYRIHIVDRVDFIALIRIRDGREKCFHVNGGRIDTAGKNVFIVHVGAAEEAEQRRQRTEVPVIPRDVVKALYRRGLHTFNKAKPVSAHRARRKGLPGAEGVHDPKIETIETAVAGLVVKYTAFARNAHGTLPVKVHVGPGGAEREDPAHASSIQKLLLDLSGTFVYAAQEACKKCTEVQADAVSVLLEKGITRKGAAAGSRQALKRLRTGLSAVTVRDKMRREPDSGIDAAEGFLQRRLHGRLCELLQAAEQEIARINPGVLAVSSIFSQINGALTVIKRVKELAPNIATILGGTNVSGEAGAAVLRHYPSVDYVFFGEGDEVFARVCRIAMGAESGPMPYGVVRHGEKIPDPIPHRMTQDMNKICYPDYSDFIAEWDREQAGEFGPPMFGEEYIEENKQLLYLSGANYVLYLEGSRGCWWGQKHPCSFCGLNGRKNVYRFKNSQRLYDEILELSRKYDNNMIQLTDNILSFDAMEQLLPMLAESEEPLNLVGEVKTNLKERDIEWLVKAGFCLVQPGIESLNDHMLQLMNKGNNAASHVAFLKYCRKHNLGLSWNLLMALPGEKEEDYDEMTGLISKIVHFQPPSGAFPIMFQRYSRYLENPEQFGLELKPYEMYRCIYGDNDDRIENMCMYYQLTGGAFKEAQARMQPWYDRLFAAVYEWKRIAASGEKRSLVMAETGNGLLLLDSRPCMVQPFTLLTGLDKSVFLACDEVKTEKQLLNALRGEAPEEEILAAAEKLIALNVLAKLGGRYVSLALPASVS